MPRAALVDHIRRLTGLHLGLYLLRVFRVAVEAEQGTSAPAPDARRQDAQGRGPALTNSNWSWTAARMHVRRWRSSPRHRGASKRTCSRSYVRSHLALKKLHEFAEYLEKSRPEAKLPAGTLTEIAALEHDAQTELIDVYFDRRIEQVVEQIGGRRRRSSSQGARRRYRAWSSPRSERTSPSSPIFPSADGSATTATSSTRCSPRTPRGNAAPATRRTAQTRAAMGARC